MDVKVVKEYADGSVDVDITNMSREEHDVILSKGFIQLIKEALDKESKAKEVELVK